MFLDTVHSERIKAGCKRHFSTCLIFFDGVVPRQNPYHTGIKSMEKAMHIMVNFYIERIYPDLGNRWSYNGFHLTLFYQSAAEIIQDEQKLNGKGHDIMRRLMFVLEHVHCEHYARIIFPSQWQDIFQRRLAVAMACHPRLGRDAGIAQLDVEMIRLSLGLEYFYDYSNLHHQTILSRWEDFFLEQEGSTLNVVQHQLPERRARIQSYFHLKLGLPPC